MSSPVISMIWVYGRPLGAGSSNDFWTAAYGGICVIRKGTLGKDWVILAHLERLDLLGGTRSDHYGPEEAQESLWKDE